MKDPVQHMMDLAARAMADAEAIPLPVWSESRRGAPAAAFRSALFPATPRKTREAVKDLDVYGVGDVVVRFTGDRFDQTDLTVYLEILHRMRNATEAVFNAHEMLQALGQSTGKANYDWLDSVIQRLITGKVQIIAPDYRYTGHLVECLFEERKIKRYTASLNPQFSRVFRIAWTSLDAEQRRELASPTAMALHAYYSSHKDPGRHRRETLCEVAGIIGKNRYQSLRKALDELVRIRFLSEWSEDPPGGITVKLIHRDSVQRGT